MGLVPFRGLGVPGAVCRDVFRVVELLQQADVAHNVFLTRLWFAALRCQWGGAPTTPKASTTPKRTAKCLY